MTELEHNWTRIHNLLLNFLNNQSTCNSLIECQSEINIHENLTNEIMEIALKKVEAKWDQRWDLVNSLYYCSSLYTTVGTYYY